MRRALVLGAAGRLLSSLTTYGTSHRRRRSNGRASDSPCRARRSADCSGQAADSTHSTSSTGPRHDERHCTHPTVIPRTRPVANCPLLRACNKTTRDHTAIRKSILLRRGNLDGYERRTASRCAVGSDRTVPSESPTTTGRWKATRPGSRVSDWHCLRPSQWHSLADAGTGTRLRFWDDVLEGGCATGN